MRKIFSIMLVLMILTSCFCISAFAEDAPEVPEISEIPDVPTPEVQEKTAFTDYTVTFRFTSDSTYAAGMSYETYSDAILDESGFKIIHTLPVGHVIYDNPETAYIDGIRINDATTNSFKVPVVDDSVSTFVVDVRTVYADGILGDIARISDGTYDWTKLLENPIMVLQFAYWALAIITVIVGIFASLFGRKTKVKTADDISSSVTSAAEAALVKIENRVTETVIEEFTPVFKTILADFENVVKAVTLFTSNSKEAPIALLDVLKDASSSNDVTSLIDSIRQVALDKLKQDEDEHTSRVALLQAIAAEAVQSDPIEAPELIEEVSTNVESPKSVF